MRGCARASARTSPSVCAAIRRHARSAIGGRERDGHSLPSARPIADVAHGVDRLARSAGGDQHAQTGQIIARGEQRRDERVQLLGLGHAARADVATGQRAVLGTDDVHATAAEHLDVVDGRRMPPHLGVHRGGHDDRCGGGQ